MTAVSAIIGKGINSLPVKVGSGDLPTLAIPPRPQQECALGRPHEQQHVAVLDIEVLNAAQHECPRTGRLFTPRFAHDSCRLNRLQRRANLARPLEAVFYVIGQTAYDHGG